MNTNVVFMSEKFYFENIHDNQNFPKEIGIENINLVLYLQKPNFIKFTKVGDYGGKKLTDEVTLSIGKNTFWGVNELKLDTVSDIDGHVIKTDRATYQVRGEKLSGTSLED